MAKFLMKPSGVGGAQSNTRRRIEVRRYFDKADKNKDGKLSKEEWHRVLNSSGVPTTREEVEDFFKSMDRDFDGSLTFEEFMGEESAIEKLFKNMDKNGDGFLTRQEFKSISKNMSHQEVEAAFSMFDTSGDDKLDYREFCDLVNRRQKM